MPVASATGLERAIMLRPEAGTNALRVVSPSGLKIRVGSTPGPDGPGSFCVALRANQAAKSGLKLSLDGSLGWMEA